MNRYYALSDDQRKELISIELSIKEKAIELAGDVKRVVARQTKQATTNSIAKN